MSVNAWKSPKRTPMASTLRSSAARSAIGFSPLAQCRKALSNAPEAAGQEEHDRDEDECDQGHPASPKRGQGLRHDGVEDRADESAGRRADAANDGHQQDALADFRFDVIWRH